MFYVQIIHGRVIVTDLEEARRERQEEQDRYYQRENERAMREDAERFRRGGK